MFKAVGNISTEYQDLAKKSFLRNGLEVEFVDIDEVYDKKIISFDKESSEKLSQKGVKFYKWDLLFSTLGPNDTEGQLEKKLEERVKILKSVTGLKSRPVGVELHGSIRVHDLAESAGFYTWLFGVEPKEWTHRYVTFLRPETKFNFVLVVSDGKELHHDTLYHLGMGVEGKDKVIEFYHSALENGFPVEKPPRTTWRGTPLHELWLKDPDGTAIEIYSRLSSDELKQMPADKEPVFL